MRHLGQHPEAIQAFPLRCTHSTSVIQQANGRRKRKRTTYTTYNGHRYTSIRENFSVRARGYGDGTLKQQKCKMQLLVFLFPVLMGASESPHPNTLIMLLCVMTPVACASQPSGCEFENREFY